MKKITLYRVFCEEYTDTRMGAHNPSYYIGKTCTSLDDCKKEIIKFLKTKGRKINVHYKDFKIKNANWYADFEPWIISIAKEKISAP